MVPRGGVFVSTGSMMPFDRLIRAMDAWAEDHPATPVFFRVKLTVLCGQSTSSPCKLAMSP